MRRLVINLRRTQHFSAARYESASYPHLHRIAALGWRRRPVTQVTMVRPFSSRTSARWQALIVVRHIRPPIAELGSTIPFSDIGLSTGAFVFVLGSPQIRCRQHCRSRGPQPRRLSPEPRDDALAVATERRPPDVILMRLGKDAPLGRQIERSVAIVITPILSGLHHCYARI